MEHLMVLRNTINSNGHLDVEIQTVTGTDSYAIIKDHVKGYIEAVRLTDTAVMWVNEEFLLHDFEPTLAIYDGFGNHSLTIHGNFIVTGVNNEGETTSLDSNTAYALADNILPNLFGSSEGKIFRGLQLSMKGFRETANKLKG